MRHMDWWCKEKSSKNLSSRDKPSTQATASGPTAPRNQGHPPPKPQIPPLDRPNHTAPSVNAHGTAARAPAFVAAAARQSAGVSVTTHRHRNAPHFSKSNRKVSSSPLPFSGFLHPFVGKVEKAPNSVRRAATTFPPLFRARRPADRDPPHSDPPP
jgi:hypothetical protein